jgi:tetratricopeptide (TPR) repeat protein
VRYESGAAADALPHFQTAVAGRPGNAAMWYNLGMAYAALGGYAEALPCVRRALALDPQMPNAQIPCGA